MEDIIFPKLRSEVSRSTGCTDPVSVVYAVASAAALLEERCTEVKVVLSKDVYRNTINVGIPGTIKRGVEEAARLGVFLKNYHSEKLEILGKLSEEEFLQSSQDYDIIVDYLQDKNNELYLYAQVSNDRKSAKVVIEHDYEFISEKWLNGKLLERSESEVLGVGGIGLSEYRLEELLQGLLDADIGNFGFLEEAAEVQKASYDQVEKSGTSVIGNAMKPYAGRSEDFPLSAILKAARYVGSLVEARMNGATVKIATTAGSGNIGITQILGTLAVCEELKADREKKLRALGVSTLVSVFIKDTIHRMTNVCGSALGAASGIAAATAYLMGGSIEQMTKAIESVLAANVAVVCDGAKESCAYKSFSAARLAVEMGYWAVARDTSVPKKNGLIDRDINATIRYLWEINRAMGETNNVIIDILKKVNIS